MNQDRLLKKGLLTEKVEKRKALDIRGERLVQDINFKLFPIHDEGLKGIRVDHVEQAVEELAEVCTKAAELDKQIKHLKEELGEEF